MNRDAAETIDFVAEGRHALDAMATRKQTSRRAASAANRVISRLTYELFIPLTDDASGVIHPQSAFDAWQIATARRFGGLTWLGLVQGSWFDPERAEIVRDHSHGYLVGVEVGREKELVAHAAEAATTFGQKCIFLERRGTAMLVYPRLSKSPRAATGSVFYPPSDAVGRLNVGETVMRYGPTPVTRDVDEEHLTLLDELVSRGVDYLEVLDFALGPGSPLLRGRSFADTLVQSSPSYVRARDRVTEYGRSLGLVGSEPSTATPMVVREELAPYGAPPSRCVSQYRAATLLGWPLDRVRSALVSGELAGRVIDGARVVDESALQSLLGS